MGSARSGPWVVTTDEFDDPDDLALGCSVDGETMQDARTSDLVFSVPRLVAELSAVLPLLPGDIIFTGTPSGIGATRQPATLPAARPAPRDLGRGHRHHPEPLRLMGALRQRLRAARPRRHLPVAHAFDEHLFDTGEVAAQLRRRRRRGSPALLLIPGQTESWWGYEEAIPLLAEHFHVHAVDLRGQGRSTRTPGRYTLDNMGNDLVRFIDGVIGRPTIVAGLSSGGVLVRLAVGLRPAGPGDRRLLRGPTAVLLRGPPAVGQGIGQSIGPLFALMAKYLGDQWTIGDWDDLVAAVPTELPPYLQFVAALFGIADTPPQTLKEYDPEWGRAFWTGSVSAACPHDRMLRAVKVPVLFTHHFRMVDDAPVR